MKICFLKIDLLQFLVQDILMKINKEHVIFERRPETLNVEDFVLLTNIIENGTVPTYRRIN